MRSKLALILLLGLGTLVFTSPFVRAESAQQGQPAPASSPDLSARAIALLRSAEDQTAKDAKLKEYRECLDLAHQAVALDEGNADAHYAIFACEGRIQLVEGGMVNPVNLMRANRELDRALQINPNHVDALAARGGLYRQLPWVLGGSLEKAEEYLNRSLILDPESPTVLIELAQTYRDKGQPERAVPLLKQAMRVAEYQKKQRPLNEARDLLRQTQALH